jgi:hypothetical protein
LLNVIEYFGGETLAWSHIDELKCWNVGIADILLVRELIAQTRVRHISQLSLLISLLVGWSKSKPLKTLIYRSNMKIRRSPKWLYISCIILTMKSIIWLASFDSNLDLIEYKTQIGGIIISHKSYGCRARFSPTKFIIGVRLRSHLWNHTHSIYITHWQIS